MGDKKKPTKSEIYEIAAEAEKWLDNERNVLSYTYEVSEALVDAAALLKEMERREALICKFMSGMGITSVQMPEGWLDEAALTKENHE